VHIVDSLNTIDPFDNIVYHFRQRQKLHEDVACRHFMHVRCGARGSKDGARVQYMQSSPIIVTEHARAPHLTCIKCLHMHGIGPCGVSIATFSPSHMNMTMSDVGPGARRMVLGCSICNHRQ
jgi:hypothetical protein